MNPQKIKIFVDAHCYDQPREGIHTFVHGIYSVLLSDYPDLDIYFGVYNTENFKKDFPTVKEDHILRYPRLSRGFIRFYTIIPKLIKKHKFHFCHFQYTSPPTIKNTKFIVTLHDVLFNDFPSGLSNFYRYSRNYFFKRSFQQAAIRTTVSSFSKQQISRVYDMAEDKINVIPSGLSDVANTNRIREQAIKRVKEEYGISDFILFVSRIEPRKNHLVLLEAYLELELYKKNIPLIFVGKKSISIPELEKKISSLSAVEKEFFYWFPYAETRMLGDLYLSCKLFVYPSLAEGFGVPPLEAAALGRPVLCSSATAMKDFSFFEPNMFDPTNKKELKQKLSDLLHDAPPDEMLSEIAAQIRSRYSWKTNAGKLYSLLIKSN